MQAITALLLRMSVTTPQHLKCSLYSRHRVSPWTFMSSQTVLKKRPHQYFSVNFCFGTSHAQLVDELRFERNFVVCYM